MRLRAAAVLLVLVAAVAATARQMHGETGVTPGRRLSATDAAPAPKAAAAAATSTKKATSTTKKTTKNKAVFTSAKNVKPPPNRALPKGTVVLTAAQKATQTKQLTARAAALGLSTAYPCPIGDALCYCKWRRTSGKTKTIGYFADNDPTVACSAFYWCYAVDTGAYYKCQKKLIFDEAKSVCNYPLSKTYPNGATCPAPGGSSPAPASPSPTPTPSPSPSPTPTPSPSPSPTPTPSPSPSPTPTPSPSPSPTPIPSPSPSIPSPSPSPVTSPSPAPGTDCPLGDATCFCQARGQLGMFADTATGCKNYFWCVGPGQYYYKPCGDGLLFNEKFSYCDWPANVACVPTSPGPSSPSPSPSASPSPSPSPSTPPSNDSSPSPSPSPNPPSPPGQYLYSAYFQTWSDPWASSASASKIASLPPYVNLVILSFMLPDTTYPGGVTFAGTGVQFSSDAAVVKDAIALLKQRNPNTKVLIAVGGATYTGWDNYRPDKVAAFVEAFGLDGVDIDYEPASAGCTWSWQSTGGSCPTDALFNSIIVATRAAIPRPKIVSAAVWSIGAYGTGAWANSQPKGDHTGMSINPLRTHGDKLDILNVMSYDAGSPSTTGYVVSEAYDAYRALFPNGKVLMGLEVPPEAWGGNVITLPQVDSICSYVKANGGDGLMLWSLQKAGTPSAQQISSAACTCLGLGTEAAPCSTPLVKTAAGPTASLSAPMATGAASTQHSRANAGISWP